MLIDSEYSRSKLFADQYEFDLIELYDPKSMVTIELYKEALTMCKQAGYPIVIIDGMSPAWDDQCFKVERVARDKYKGNTFAAWGDKGGTEHWKEFLDRYILQYPGHIIMTMRQKIVYTQSKDQNGKTVIQRDGEKPEMGKSTEYEMTIHCQINRDDHVMTIIKTPGHNTGLPEIIEKPDFNFGIQLFNAINKAAPIVPKEKTLLDKVKEGIGECKEGKKLDKDGNKIELRDYLIDLQKKIAKYKDDPFYEDANDVIKNEMIKLTTDHKGEE
jgi:hypothetical protein